MCESSVKRSSVEADSYPSGVSFYGTGQAISMGYVFFGVAIKLVRQFKLLRPIKSACHKYNINRVIFML
jgi:hypothetical protein